MDLLDKLIKAIQSFNFHKYDKDYNTIVKRKDVISYAISLMEYIKDNIETIDQESLFTSKAMISYFFRYPLSPLALETDQDKEEYEGELKKLEELYHSIDYGKHLGNFDEFIKYLYLPKVNTGKEVYEVLSNVNSYETADDLYRMMQLAVARPNDKLFKGYSRGYKTIKLAYIKLISEVILEEYEGYPLELSVSEKQLIDLAKMIVKYLDINKGSIHYENASGYLDNTLQIILKMEEK